MPYVQWKKGLANVRGVGSLYKMQTKNIGHCWNDISRDTKTSSIVVSSHVVYYQPEIWRKRLGLKRVLGLGSYQTAWSWLHKMRRAMVRPGRDKLGGITEVDETFVGGEDQGGKRGRGTERKSIVLIALEIHEPKGYGRVRMKCVSNASSINLVPFVCSVVLPGSEVRTDSWGGYNKLEELGYVHKKINLSVSSDPTHVLMPGVHRISSLLKRWLLSTHQGAVSGKHLDYYLDEYSFRFNRRNSKARGMLFYRLLQQAVVSGPLSFKEIVNGKGKRQSDLLLGQRNG